MTRRIVQIAAAESPLDGDDSTGTLYALDDTGDVWYMVSPWRCPEWHPLPPLPDRDPPLACPHCGAEACDCADREDLTPSGEPPRAKARSDADLPY